MLHKQLLREYIPAHANHHTSAILCGVCKQQIVTENHWGENEGTSKSWSFGATSPAGVIAPPQNVLPEKDKRMVS